MTEPSFMPGEIIEISMRVRVGSPEPHHQGPGERDPGETLYPVAAVINGNELPMSLPLGSPQLKITRIRPADGEPRPGQIWATPDGTEWHASGTRTGGYGCRMTAADGRQDAAKELHRVSGPIRLIRDAPKPQDGGAL